MKQSIIAITSTIILLILLMINVIYGAQTYQMSIDIIKYLQNLDGIFYDTIRSLIIIFSLAGNRTFANYILLYMWIKAGKKEQILKIITIQCLSSFIGDLVQLILAEPKPFYIDESIEPTVCQSGFGDPAGHTLRSIVFYVLISETIVFKKYRIHNKDQGVMSAMNRDYTIMNKDSYEEIKYDKRELYGHLYPNSSLSYDQCQILLLLFIILTGLSRLYMGLHFVNQIFIAWAIGIYILTLYYYCGLENFLEQLFYQAIHKLPQSRERRINKTIKVAIVFLSLILLSFFMYYLVTVSETIQNEEQIWIKNLEKRVNCQVYEAFEDTDLIYSSIICLPFYLYLACSYTSGQYKPQDYPKSVFTLLNLVRALIIMAFLTTFLIVRSLIRIYDMPILLRYILQGQFYYAILTLCQYHYYHQYINGQNQTNQEIYFVNLLKLNNRRWNYD